MIWGLVMTLLAMVGWVAKIPMFGAEGLLPATSSALIVCPLAFLINIVVSNLTADRLSDDSADKGDKILRKLHNLPGCKTE
jgi:cation/acetate symporter